MLLATWKLFKKKKTELEKTNHTEYTTNNENEELKSNQEINDDNFPILEHEETLYSDEKAPKEKKPNATPRKRWETSQIVEEKVDSLESKKNSKTSIQKGDIEKKVDMLINKDKKPSKSAQKLKTPDGYKKSVNKKTGLTYYKKKK